VSGDGSIVGVQTGAETFNDWRNQISQSSDPTIIPEIESFDIHGRTIAIITVQEWPIKPVAIKGRHYKRVGNSNRPLNAEEVTSLHLETTGRSWDYQKSDDYAIQDIDTGKVEKYIQISQKTGRRQIGGDEIPLDVLRKLNLITHDRPTFASLLLFGGEDRKFISQAAIHCGRFLSETEIDDDRMITGTLMTQIEEGIDFIKKHIKKSLKIKDTARREDVWEYPLDATREAIINAVCHRDYTLPSKTEVRIFDDSLAIWNPGGLPRGLTIDDLYRPHPSVLRNKGIGAALYDMGYIEQWGSGIERMRQACLRADLPEPKFEEYQGGFRVTFSKDVYTGEKLQSMGLNEQQAINYVKRKGRISNSKYQELCNTSERTATRDLSELVESGIFIQIGRTGRGTNYALRRHNDAIDATKTP
jgi:ATP-dependent DNA helicase RecG